VLSNVLAVWVLTRHQHSLARFRWKLARTVVLARVYHHSCVPILMRPAWLSAVRGRASTTVTLVAALGTAVLLSADLGMQRILG
jgi:hypothetical protein